MTGSWFCKGKFAMLLIERCEAGGFWIDIALINDLFTKLHGSFISPCDNVAQTYGLLFRIDLSPIVSCKIAYVSLYLIKC